MGKSIAIGIVVAISIVHYSILGYLGYDPMPESQSLMGWCFSLTLALWCLDDAKRQRFHRPYEFGAFIFFLWPFVLPAYLIRTRGWRGSLLFVAILALALLPAACGWLAFHSGPASTEQGY